MNILVISDCPHIDEIRPQRKPDVVFLLGDMDYYLLREIDRLFTCSKFGVMGNHDGPDYFEGTDIVNVHGKVVEFEGFRVAGLEGSPRYNRRSFLQYEETEVNETIKELKDINFFLSHSNPSCFTNDSPSGAHKGFESLTDYVVREEPAYLFHGHLHIAEEYKIKNTKVVSVFPFYEFILT